VFGGAPVVNTFVTTISQGTLSQVPFLFYFSLLLVIVGAVTVLVFAPRPTAVPAKSEAAPPRWAKSAMDPAPAPSAAGDAGPLAPISHHEKHHGATEHTEKTT
jgi:hypothetical protein